MEHAGAKPTAPYIQEFEKSLSRLDYVAAVAMGNSSCWFLECVSREVVISSAVLLSGYSAYSAVSQRAML
jgi:hypothetical protein